MIGYAGINGGSVLNEAENYFAFLCSLGRAARAEFRNLNHHNRSDDCQRDDPPVRRIRRYGLQHARQRRIPDGQQLQCNHHRCRAPDISVREQPGQRRAAA